MSDFISAILSTTEPTAWSKVIGKKQMATRVGVTCGLRWERFVFLLIFFLFQSPDLADDSKPIDSCRTLLEWQVASPCVSSVYTVNSFSRTIYINIYVNVDIQISLSPIQPSKEETRNSGSTDILRILSLFPFGSMIDLLYHRDDCGNMPIYLS